MSLSHRKWLYWYIWYYRLSHHCWFHIRYISGNFWTYFYCTAHAQKWLYMSFRLNWYRRSQEIDLLVGATFQRFEDIFRLIFRYANWKSATFLLPVYLTYWPRKYHMLRPHDDNFHQVWSRYDVSEVSNYWRLFRPKIYKKTHQEMR